MCQKPRLKVKCQTVRNINNLYLERSHTCTFTSDIENIFFVSTPEHTVELVVSRSNVPLVRALCGSNAIDT